MDLIEARAFIEAVPWKSAKSTEDVAPHQYATIRAVGDDERFWAFVGLIKTRGRKEQWTPPAEWVRRWGGKPMTNRYLYVGEFAYFFTWPRNSIPMINREATSVQEATPTRRPLPEQRTF